MYVYIYVCIQIYICIDKNIKKVKTLTLVGNNKMEILETENILHIKYCNLLDY